MVGEKRHGERRPLVGTPEAAAYIGMSEKFVRSLRANRTLPCYKIGRSVKFDLDDLDRYLAERREAAIEPSFVR